MKPTPKGWPKLGRLVMPTPVHATASVLLVAVLIGLPGTTVAQDPPGAPELPRSPDDRPDLHGVWYFNTTTPLQRPERLGDKARYTEEEHAALAARSAEFRPFDAHPPAGSVGAYNQFWWDRGGPVDDRRTSLIVDPDNGRLPPLTSGATRQVGSTERHVPGPGPVRYRIGGISADGPEERGLSARCLLGYTVGPPLLPGGYNNNLQLFQSADHVVILTEMVHDARIVPLTRRPHVPEAVRLWNGDSRGALGRGHAGGRDHELH